MGKFCSNCGKELKEDQDVCLGCGKVVKKEEPVKKNHNGYITATGIIMIILGLCLICATGYDEIYKYPILVYTIPGLLALTAGILNLCSKKELKYLKISGIILLVGAFINFIGIIDVSLYSICAIIFGILNIKYSKNDLENNG